MGIFGRRRAQPGEIQRTEGTSSYLGIIPPQVPTGPHGVTAGWAPGYGTPHAQQQIGRFAGTMLSQYPARIDGVQLHSGREWGCSSWYYPTVRPVVNGSVQQTQQPAALPGAQRYGSRVQSAFGPISVRQMNANVAAAQVRQSGLQAMQWAQGLSNQ